MHNIRGYGYRYFLDHVEALPEEEQAAALEGLDRNIFKKSETAFLRGFNKKRLPVKGILVLSGIIVMVIVTLLMWPQKQPEEQAAKKFMPSSPVVEELSPRLVSPRLVDDHKKNEANGLRQVHTPWGLPGGDGPEPVFRASYAVEYDVENQIARWAAFKIQKGKTISGPSVKADPNFPEDKQRPDSLFRGIYDRGSLIPKSLIQGAAHIKEQRYRTVLIPQTRQFLGFRNSLHRQIAKFEGDIWVMLGPILDGKHLKGKLPYPNQYFYIVVRDKGDRLECLPLIIPTNGSTDAMASYLTSVQEIEKSTGLNFFSELSRTEQASIEGEVPKEMWVR